MIPINQEKGFFSSIGSLLVFLYTEQNNFDFECGRPALERTEESRKSKDPSEAIVDTDGRSLSPSDNNGRYIHWT